MKGHPNLHKYFQLDVNTVRRIKFLERLPKNAVVAEVGVWYGKNARNIWQAAQPEMLYLIDSWRSVYIKGDEKIRTTEIWDEMYQMVVDWASDKQIKVIRKTSQDAVMLFEDQFFDWVYVDAGHSFESCLNDLVIWHPKVKTGGYICGHDYCETAATDKKGFGVKRAVDEFIKQNKLEIEFLSENKHATDYAIKVKR